MLCLFIQRSSVAPRAFLNLSRPPWFQSSLQQDCSEYLKYLLDKLQTESVDSKDDINSLLSGKMRTSVECFNCGFVSLREELFNDIPLSFHHEQSSSEECLAAADQTLKGGDSSDRLKRKIDSKLSQSTEAKQTITDDNLADMTSQLFDLTSTSSSSQSFTINNMLCSYLTPEILEDSNKYFCERCASLQNAKKTIEIIEYPRYLILTMKRFTYNVATQKRSKLLHVVDHPQSFTLCTSCSRCHDEKKTLTNNEPSPGTSRLQQSDEENLVGDKQKKYEDSSTNHFRLLSVIVHSGQSSDSGHYYAYTCENAVTSDEMSWSLLNDSRVSAASNDCISKLSSRFPMDTPYVCIYEGFRPDQEEHPRSDIKVQQFLLDHVQADDELYQQVS